MTALPVHPFADALPQRRDRRPANLRAYATREDGSVIDVTLVDLSYDGCGIDCPLPLRPGETMKLAVHRRGMIMATVRWAVGGKAGLQFEPLPISAKSEDPRRHERIAVEAEISLRRSGKLNFRVRLYDLSPVGCKAEFVERPEIGEQVWIKFDEIEALEAEVCWVAGARAGMRFNRPIQSAVFDLLVQRMR